MKKQLLSLSLLLSISFGVKAQNFKNLSAPVNFLGIPNIVQNASINTYSVVVSSSESQLNKLGYTSESLADKVSLRAFTKVQDLGENKIVFRFGGYGDLYGKLGSVTGSDGKTSYNYSYSYTLPVSYEIYAGIVKIGSGEIKMDKQQMNMASSEQFSFSTKWFPSSTEASQNWNSPATNSALIAHIKGNFDAKVATFVKTIVEQIDYPSVKDYTQFGYFKTTKKANFTDYENAAESAKRAVGTLVAGQDREGLRSKLDSSMSFWRSNLAKLDPTNKDEDKIFFVCANNLAVAYHWMDKTDSAMFFIGLAEKADVREGYLSMLKYEVENRRKKLIALNSNGINPYSGPSPASETEVNEIHARIEKQKLERDAAIAASVALAEKATAPVINIYDGYIINREDKRVNGKFKCYRENTGENYGKNFFIEAGTEKEVEISAGFIKACEYNSQRYELVKFIDASGLGKETKLLPVIYESPKIKVYKDRSTVTNSNLNYIYFRRPTEEVATNTSNMAFTVTYKKQLAKYFGDCPDVANKALAGAYTDSDDMRVAAAVDYTNCK